MENGRYADDDELRDLKTEGTMAREEERAAEDRGAHQSFHLLLLLLIFFYKELREDTAAANDEWDDETSGEINSIRKTAISSGLYRTKEKSYYCSMFERVLKTAVKKRAPHVKKKKIPPPRSKRPQSIEWRRRGTLENSVRPPETTEIIIYRYTERVNYNNNNREYVLLL